jgi:hypothetical protein
MLNDINLPFDEDYWLELEVGSEILDPRQKISMSAYSARSDTSDYSMNSDLLQTISLVQTQIMGAPT